jgi:hypothetical protein
MRVFTYAVYVMLKNFYLKKLKNQKENLQYFHEKLKKEKLKTKRFDDLVI